MIVKDELQLTEAVLAETGRADDLRFREIVQALVRHLHDFAREVRLTEAEFDASINAVARLGQLTTPSHNEVRLMAGSLGLSTLVCLMNNGTEEKPTSANLLGPFWRQGAPVMNPGDSIVRSPTEGPPLFFTGTVVDTGGQPVAGAEVDVWHASPVGLYENQDPGQAITSQIYSHDDPMLDTDAQFGVTRALIASYERHEPQDETVPAPDVTEPWYTLGYTFVVEPGEAWRPTPPVSAKSQANAAGRR